MTDRKRYTRVRAQMDRDRYRMRVADGIRRARKAKSITQRDLALLTGSVPAMIVRWEAGAVTPHVHTLARIAHACGVPVASLIPEIDDGEQ